MHKILLVLPLIVLQACASNYPIEMEEEGRMTGPRLSTLPIAMLTMGMIGDPEYEKEKKELESVNKLLEDKQDSSEIVLEKPSKLGRLVNKLSMGTINTENNLIEDAETNNNISKIDKDILEQHGKATPKKLVSLDPENVLYKLEYGKSNYQQAIEVLGEPKTLTTYPNKRKTAEFQVKEAGINGLLGKTQLIVLRFNTEGVLEPVEQHEGYVLDERDI